MDRPPIHSPPCFLKAMGRKPLPESIELGGSRYERVLVFKHDFFAATALYRNIAGRQVVLKIGRQGDFLGLPMGWIGRFLARREAHMYQALHDLPGVPGFAGRWGDHAFAHDYVEGRPLRRDDQVGDRFFDQLAALLEEIHRRSTAYVDLEKCENIILGDDGKPWLIDFQISWSADDGWLARFPPARKFLAILQHMDRYHLLKHRRRLRPDQLSEQAFESFQPPLYIRIHRTVVRPLQKIRRWLLGRLDPAHTSAPR